MPRSKRAPTIDRTKKDRKEPTINRKIPLRKMASIKMVLQAISKHVEQHDRLTHLPQGIDPASAAVTYSLYRIAVRSNDGLPKIWCPRCRAYHSVSISAPCPKCQGQEWPVVIQNANLERNSINASAKIIDKLFPDLKNVETNFGSAMVGMADEITRIIVQYVPGERRMQCLAEIQQAVNRTREAVNAATE